MNQRTLETLVGLFVLIGMAALLFLALKAANLTSFGQREAYTVSAAFDNIGGLKPRAAVRSAGVTVGRVSSIRLDTKSYKGVVTMTIDADAHFPDDSSAKILTSGLLGDQYIGIEPGGAQKNLASGSVIMDSFAPTSTLAVKYSSQNPCSAKMLIVPMAGLESGSITRKKIAPCPPPSTITDSKSASGKLRKKFRKKNVCPQTLVAT